VLILKYQKFIRQFSLIQESKVKVKLSKEKNNKLQFGLMIPQGWRGGDRAAEEENNPVK
jgi:hypothetical protein